MSLTIGPPTTGRNTGQPPQPRIQALLRILLAYEFDLTLINVSMLAPSSRGRRRVLGIAMTSMSQSWYVVDTFGTVVSSLSWFLFRTSTLLHLLSAVILGSAV